MFSPYFWKHPYDLAIDCIILHTKMMKVSHDERNTQLKVLKTPDLLGLIQVYDINIFYMHDYACVFIFLL